MYYSVYNGLPVKERSLLIFYLVFILLSTLASPCHIKITHCKENFVLIYYTSPVSKNNCFYQSKNTKVSNDTKNYPNPNKKRKISLLLHKEEVTKWLYVLYTFIHPVILRPFFYLYYLKTEERIFTEMLTKQQRFYLVKCCKMYSLFHSKVLIVVQNLYRTYMTCLENSF